MSTDTSVTAAAVVEHAADEAGGEVVFSSDGWNPPPIPLRPPPIRQTQTDSGGYDATGGGVGLDYSNVSAEQAFEAFAGKLYPVHVGVGVGVGGGGGGVTAASSTSQKGTTETPLERLQRLHAEVNELETDLQQQQQQQAGGDDDTALAMLTSIQQIKTRLEAQAQSAANARLPFMEQQQALAKQIASSTSTSALREPLPTAATTTATSSLPSPTDTAILSRLQKLEAVLGGGGGGGGGGAAVASTAARLAVLEKTMSRLDEKELEALTKKAKVIRQDLEAASKARSKLMSVVTSSSSSSSGSGAGSISGSAGSSSTNIRAEDSKTITDLHDELVQLQGMTQHLPVLAQRLQSLAHLHASTATFAARLQAMEDLAVHKLPPQVAVLEGALDKMEANLQQSAQQMMNNVKALQERVEKL